MKISKKTFLGAFVVLGSVILSSCSDDGEGSKPASITGTPTSVNVEFTSNTSATIGFDKTSSLQNNFNVRLTDQYNEVIEFEGITEVPIVLSSIPKGNIYTVEVAGGGNAEMGAYGKKSETYLASKNIDENSMIRIDMLNAINKARATARICGGDQMAAVHPLVWDDKLEEAAEIHTKDMDNNSFFAHQSPTDNSSPSDRINRAGYSWTSSGENIHYGSSNAEAAVASWLNSPPHCKNIMSPGFNDVGSYNSSNLWTQVFGKGG